MAETKLDLATQVQGILAAQNGGTGGTGGGGGSLPDQTGHSGSFLTTNGSSASWQPLDAGTF